MTPFIRPLILLSVSAMLPEHACVERAKPLASSERAEAVGVVGALEETGGQAEAMLALRSAARSFSGTL